MSQAKVDRYKQEKRNREKIIKKEKREWMATKVGLSIVGLVMVAWIGVSAYNAVNTTTTDDTTTELPTYTVDTSALDDFVDSLSAD
jgi:predicted anti-sigma-YlaC factor YlaD